MGRRRFAEKTSWGLSSAARLQQPFLDLVLPQLGAGGQTGAGGGQAGAQTGAQIVPPAMVPRVLRSSVFIVAILWSGIAVASRSQS
ncbi:hypothetical protein NS228_06925 [Methylobacterium indicum]|uniref:Uncharacterized protein n=1 Tax=Methylobacterium indicum TaxID=1775910 RepID=A0ABR5H3U2_9HYPH|nr:hypothetical protein QR78_19625 [Methylobacterium indicum]KMO18327.1 hypothetical protein QR79_20510 [Methylobacterium indicum]KTS17739.1 hypothetical protein NS229_26720 [Methylobacterium indicum]KTS41343.1 hypothetical protein NS228_06925 [Methylobacterium indicum]KTS44038.1 hypothetical protein NS230_26030 [Methylobacterium indicum]